MTDSDYMNRVLDCERRLYRISRSILWNDPDCADAIQEAVVKGWLKRDTLRNPDYFDTWLIRILINECHNIQRKSRLKTLPLDDQAGLQAQGLSEENVQLRMALEALPEKYRLVLIMHHLEGFSLDEIASALSIPKTMVKSRLHQARKNLRTLLEMGDDA